MSKDLIKEKLNKFGSKKEPFLFVLSYNLEEFYIEKLSELPNNIRFELNSKEHHKSKINKKYKLEKFPISFDEYKKKFDYIQEQIKSGNSYLLNLTAQTKIKSTLTLDEIYDSVSAKFKLRFQNIKDDFVCFSPERFIEIKKNKIYTYPMKGTIDASITNAQARIYQSISAQSLFCATKAQAI